jgi:hypothetical protein
LLALSRDLEGLLQPWRDRGFFGQGEWNGPIFVVWLLMIHGRGVEAGQQLIHVRKHHLDGDATARDRRVILRLFHRLGFVTDDFDRWGRLADPISVYRAGDPDEHRWTTDKEIAKYLAREHNIDELYAATIYKRDVLAFITGYGEEEIFVDGGIRDVRPLER